MAFARSSLPVLTTSLPPNGSSSSSSSPLTPFSELGPEYNTLRSRLTTPTTTPDVPKPCTSYITYPEPAVPPRQLTPPPKSRFVPLFESISKAANSPTDLSRRGSLGDDEASPIAPPISLPFSSAVTTQMRKRLSLTSNHMSIEPTLKSAPLSGSSFGNSPWTRHCALSASADILHDHLSHTEQLNDVIRSLRHQLNVKTHRLHTAEAEVARLSSAYASLADEKAKLVEDYAHARARIDDLEAKICAEERCTFRRDIRDSHQTTSQSRRSLTREPRTPIWAMDHGKRGVTPLDSEAKEEQVPADEKDNSPPALSVSAEAYQSVLTRIPEMPSDVIVASLAEVFLSPDFDFLQWLGTNGLQLPESAKLLADLSWEDRLRLGAGDLDRLGVRSASDRSYIMRVLKAIAKGEVCGIPLVSQLYRANGSALGPSSSSFTHWSWLHRSAICDYHARAAHRQACSKSLRDPVADPFIRRRRRSHHPPSPEGRSSRDNYDGF